MVDVDPVTVTLALGAASGAAGGAAGAIVKKVLEAGGGWLSTYFDEHEPAVQAAASINASDFLDRLASRVTALEGEPQDAATTERIKAALNDPDFAGLLRDSLISSARTTSDEKHEILARVVSERLRYDGDSLVGLTVPLAAEAVGRLTSKQLRYLGVTTLVTGIRPTPFPPVPARTDDWYGDWLRMHLAPYHPLPSLLSMDFRHLESTGCARQLAFVGLDLANALKDRAREPFDWPFDDFVKDGLGRELRTIWSDMQRLTLTTAGTLIGIYVHDRMTNMRTRIDWG